MTPEQLHDALVELARSVGFGIRRSGGRVAGETDLPLASGFARARDEVWVVLSSADPVEERIEVLAAALRTHAAAELEDRYLPPAVRDRLDA